VFDVLISGKLIRDPQVRMGQSGKPFTTALVRVPVEGGEESVMASVIAFGEVGERLGRLKSSDAVSLTGSAKLSSWEKDGELKHGLGVTVSGLLTAYEAGKRRGASSSASSAEPRRKSRSAPPPQEAEPDLDFDDPIPY
jgi:single-strand DNA-binding protein